MVERTLLPDVDELLDNACVVSIPLRMRFRGIDQREALLVRGPYGWGEFSPFVEYGDDEAARWLAAAIEAAWQEWPKPLRDRVLVNATVPAVPADGVAQVLARFDGCETVKVKVAERGQSRAEDIDRVAAVREAWPHAQIRVDANGGWDVGQAREMLTALAHFGLEYAEQPCARVEQLAELRVALAHDGVEVAVAADESVRKAEDPLRVRQLEAADVIVVKVAPLSGVETALRIVAEVGLPAVVSSALDTSVGIGAGVALAAALPELPYACGLGTAQLLAGDVTTTPLVPTEGGIVVAERPSVDNELVDRFAATPERDAWWRARLRRCHAVLNSAA